MVRKKKNKQINANFLFRIRLSCYPERTETIVKGKERCSLLLAFLLFFHQSFIR